MKEDNLQDLLDAKSQALLQADRLIAQYRSRQGRHGAEVAVGRPLGSCVTACEQCLGSHW